MKRLWGGVFALICAVVGGVTSAVLTTPYKNMIKAGASYEDALKAGLDAVGQDLVALTKSPWFLIPVALAVVISLTATVTARLVRPRPDSDSRIADRMSQFVVAGRNDKMHRSHSLYSGTMQLCGEIDAFMTTLQKIGFDVPCPQSKYAEDWVDIAMHYYALVGPQLRSGNASEARHLAKAIAAQSPIKTTLN